MARSDGPCIALRRSQGRRYEEAKAQIKAFPSEFGDCRQDLVFIGVDMDEAAIRGALDNCLLRSKEEIDAFKQAWDAEKALRVR